jgi:hypothetical protein
VAAAARANTARVRSQRGAAVSVDEVAAMACMGAIIAPVSTQSDRIRADALLSGAWAENVLDKAVIYPRFSQT